MNELPKLASEIMTRDVVTLDERQTLENIEHAMRALRFRHMPVTDGRRLIGVISQRDLLRTSASTLLPARREQADLLAKWFTVGDVMTRDVQTVHPDTPLSEVTRLMRRSKLGCLPVVENENTLVGIITEADFVKLCERLLARP
jgi:CBS domain-containing membrane protein